MRIFSLIMMSLCNYFCYRRFMRKFFKPQYISVYLKARIHKHNDFIEQKWSTTAHKNALLGKSIVAWQQSRCFIFFVRKPWDWILSVNIYFNLAHRTHLFSEFFSCEWMLVVCVEKMLNRWSFFFLRVSSFHFHSALLCVEFAFSFLFCCSFAFSLAFSGAYLRNLREYKLCYCCFALAPSSSHTYC